MHARVMRPFTMGDNNFQKDQIIDLSEERINRLIGEGLVDVCDEQTQVKESAPAADKSATVTSPETSAGKAEKPKVAKPRKIKSGGKKNA